MAQWKSSDIAPQRGRTVVVTGTGGLGLEMALVLARAGANVILAGRNPAKGAAAIERIRREFPGGSVWFEELDLADLDSIAVFGKRLRSSLGSLSLLINNAGVMTPPRRRVTADGFELQLGTNHLGHFALTAELLPLLGKGAQSRVVTLSSVAARSGRIDFTDLQCERHYKPMVAYAQSKLANLMFAFELQRRSSVAGWGIQSIAAHPGISRTDLLLNGAGASSAQGLARRYLWFLFQPAEQGALPALYAATSPEAQAGAYYGPDKFNEIRGYPARAKVPSSALELPVATKLWEESERLTGASFSLDDALYPNVAGFRTRSPTDPLAL